MIGFRSYGNLRIVRMESRSKHILRKLEVIQNKSMKRRKGSTSQPKDWTQAFKFGESATNTNGTMLVICLNSKAKKMMTLKIWKWMKKWTQKADLEKRRHNYATKTEKGTQGPRNTSKTNRNLL